MKIQQAGILFSRCQTEMKKGDDMSVQSTANVALFLADGCEEIEALTVADLLYRAGIPCTTISVMETTTIRSSHGLVITAQKSIADTDLEEYSMLVLPGGIPGTPNLASCAKLMDAVVSFAGRGRDGKAVAAICAAPSILANLGLLQGLPATCNPCVNAVLEEKGALRTDAPAVTCGNIITSRSMGTAIAFGLAIVSYYQGQSRADDLAEKILYCRGDI